MKAAKRKGLDYDIRRSLYDEVQQMSLADVQRFHAQHIQSNQYNLLVLGSRDRLDIEGLSNFGEVEEIDFQTLFGYNTSRFRFRKKGGGGSGWRFRRREKRGRGGERGLGGGEGGGMVYAGGISCCLSCVLNSMHKGVSCVAPSKEAACPYRTPISSNCALLKIKNRSPFPVA